VYSNRFGENAKFELAGDRLGAILGVGVLDYLMELAVAANLKKDARRSEEGKSTGAVAWCPMPWRLLR
jgi:hypothetical protein